MRRGRGRGRGQGRGRGDDDGLDAAAAAWLTSYPKVSAWMAKHDLRQLLQLHGGLVRVPDFLPPHIADSLLSMLQSYSPRDWTRTAADQDPSANNIDHEFWSTKNGRGMASLTRALTLLLPGCLHSFSAAKYCSGHHIAPHDDRQYSQVLMDDGQVITCSRDIAVIYYLTKDWKEEYGGHLVDLEGHTTLIPMFNSLVAFSVPRYHEVTPLTTHRPRYSVFGWFLEPGIKYDLYKGESQEGQAGQQQQQQGQQEEQQLRGLQEEQEQEQDHTSTAAVSGNALEPPPAARRAHRMQLQRRRSKLLAAQGIVVFGHLGSRKLTRRRLLLRAKAAAAAAARSSQAAEQV